MNKIFKIIWNKTTQRIEVVSELAKGAVKASSGSHQSKSIAIKSTLKLSLLSLCLGYTNEAMALANIDGKTTFHAPKGGVLTQNGNGKYAVGVYDKESASFAFGYAQAGRKDEDGDEPASVGGKQLAIGNDNLTASGWNSIAIGSNSNRKGGSQGMGTIAIGAGMQAIGRNVVSIGTDSGSGGKYNGYDDAVYLGSYSRINNKGQGQTQTDEALKALEKTYTDAVVTYNGSGTGDNLNKVIAAGKAINNVALNKVDAMAIEYNITEKVKTKGENNKDIEVTISKVKKDTITPVNASAGDKTVSILSIGGKIPKPGIQNPTKETDYTYMYRQIQNVAAGRIASDSNDAVNGSQLYYVRNYTGWNIGHYDDVTNMNKITGRVNNDHNVVFKGGSYTDVWTELDTNNKTSTINIEAKTSDIEAKKTSDDNRIESINIINPIGKDANNTVARSASVKTALDTFNEVKADKVDIMGYSHVNSNGNTRDEALLKADGTKATFNYEGRNNSSITNASEGKTKDNNGKYAEASGAQADRSIASGVYANALAKDSIAIGTGANVNNYWGSQFRESINGIAIGKLAQVEGSEGAIAFGAGSTILRNLSYNVGSANAIAIGNGSKITAASGAIAIGNNTNITAIDTAVTGNGAVNAIAIGNGATVERRNSIALGQGTKASGVSSIALGDGTKVSGDNTVAIGTNVTAAKENSVVIGQNASATKERVVAIGAYAKADGDRTVAIGPEATASASRSIVIGGLGDNATDNKAQSDKGADQAIVIGNGAQAKAAASYSITLGNSAKTEAVTGISIGDRANVASGANSGIALGKSAVANKSGDIAIGESSSTSAKHTVSGLKIGDATLSTGVAATDNGTVSFGKNDIKRQIQNVGAGEISDKSSDVITGSQLYHVIKAADEIAKTEYKFTVGGRDVRVMGNKGLSTKNNESNTLNFAAADGLDVEGENGTVTYKLNADSKQAITDAKTAATTVTNKLDEINQSVASAETAAKTAITKAGEAAQSATDAKASKDAAAQSATDAKASKDAAAQSATDAKASKDAAAQSATDAKASKDAAAQSATDAKASKDAAAQSATDAKASKDAAAQSATDAKASKDAAAQSATDAKASKDAAAQSATDAKASKDAAAQSATDAKASKDAAAQSATDAKASKDAAAQSATDAKASKDAAAQSATDAKASKDAAAQSATDAKASKDAAAESAQQTKAIETRIEKAGLISKDGKTAFAADNTSGRNSAKASGKDSTAMGYGSEAEGDHSTALGNNAKAHAERSTAIGHNAEVKAKAAGSVALGEGSVAEEKDTISVGNVGHERRITNVQDPNNLTDAANKRYVDHSVNSVRNELKQTDRKLRGGIAGAVAMANIPTANRAGGTMVGIGVGSFKGQSAVAVGINRASDSNRVHFKMSGSATTSGDYAVGAGMGYQW